MADNIIVIIDNKTPIRADALGELFTAFARDYRDMTRGGTLVVTRLEQGSTFIEWTDFVLTHAGHYAEGAVETIKAVKNLADFTKTLKSLFGKKKQENAQHQAAPRKKKKPLQRSAEAIARIAAENHCHARVKLTTTAEGETLEFELTPAEAIDFREAARHERKAIRGLPPDQTAGIDVQRASEAFPELMIPIRQLYDAQGGKLSTSDIDNIAEVLIEVIESSGLSRAAEQIAAGLEAHGLGPVASVLRRKVRSSSGKHEPPLTTT